MKRVIRSANLFVFLCLLPTLALMTFLIVVPVLRVFQMAFGSTDTAGRVTGWVGWQNFARLFADPVVPQVVTQTLIWTVAVLLLGTLFSVALALVLNLDFRGRALARAVVFAPWAVSFVFTAVIWKYIYDPYYGFMNPILRLFLGQDFHASWLGNPSLALPAVIWVGITLTIPFTTIVTLSGLQSIPAELIEAAQIDGANAWRSFVHIIVPLLQPVLTVATLVNLIAIFNSFPIIWTMTEGGPVNYTDTLVTYMYKRAFRGMDFGVASAISVLSFIALTLVSIVYVRKTAKDVF